LGTTSFTYDNADRVLSQTSPAPSGSGEGRQTTARIYDDMGRVKETISPDGSHSYTSYYPTGLVKRVWGGLSYPVYYQWTPQGRQWKLTTSEGSAQEATITWEYDSQRGWLTSKRFADNQGPSFTYSAGGRMESRTWARGVSVLFGYDAGGTLDSLNYSDGTPDVTYTIDRLGRIAFVEDGAGTAAYGYQDIDHLAQVTYTSGPLSDYSISREYDGLQRLNRLEIQDGGSVHSSVSYTYEGDTSRLWIVGQGQHLATYGYADATGHPDRIQSLSITEGGQPRLASASNYDKLGRLISVSNKLAGSSVPYQRFEYSLNVLNQRVRETREDGSYWQYGYDPKGQVTSGKRHWVDGTLVAGHQREYVYDDIGNRSSLTESGNAAGAGSRGSVYEVNALNQYESRSVPGVVDAFGEVGVGDRVAVDGKRVSLPSSATPGLDSIYWWAPVGVPNSASIARKEIRIAAAKMGGGPLDADLVALEKRSVTLPQSPENFTYDEDGNLTGDGLRTYVWDGENRLVSVHPRAGLAAQGGAQAAYYIYDHYGRRIGKTLYDVNASNVETTLVNSRSYLYDFWNLVAEIDPSVSGEVVQTWAWGLDHSGTLQGSGGVGGLLWRQGVASGTGGAHAYGYDGSGNVTLTVALQDYYTDPVDLISSEYTYDPQGNALRTTGGFAASNPFRFSTKFHDGEGENGGLVYFGFRYYSPVLGRWISRDPLEETGGYNLYSFLNNRSVGNIDVLGLFDFQGMVNDIRGWVSSTSLTIGNALASTSKAFVDARKQDALDWISKVRTAGIKGQWTSDDREKHDLVPGGALNFQAGYGYKVSFDGCKVVVKGFAFGQIEGKMKLGTSPFNLVARGTFTGDLSVISYDLQAEKLDWDGGIKLSFSGGLQFEIGAMTRWFGVKAVAEGGVGVSISYSLKTDKWSGLEPGWYVRGYAEWKLGDRADRKEFRISGKSHVDVY
jgi:RHS repeat-associated protein